MPVKQRGQKVPSLSSEADHSGYDNELRNQLYAEGFALTG